MNEVGLGPAEPHSHVARHVDDKAARCERGQIVFGEEDQRRGRVLKYAVDDDVVVRQELGHRDDTVLRCIRPCALGCVLVLSHLDDLGAGNGRAHSGHLAGGQDPHIVDAVGVQRGDRAAGGGAESDDGSAQPATVAAGDSGQLHGVQDGAITRELVVLVKDVQAEAAVGLPVVHRLEGDYRQPPIDGDLRQRGVLHAVRPSPDDLPHVELGQVLCLHFGQQNDVAVGDELLPGTDSTDEFGQRVLRGAEVRAVAVLEEDPRPDPIDRSC